MTISTAVPPAQTNWVTGQPAANVSRVNERRAFAATLDQLQSDKESASAGTTVREQSGPPLSSRSRQIAPDNGPQGNTRSASTHAKPAERDDEQQHINTSPAAEDGGNATAPTAQPIAVPVQASVCVPQIPPILDDAAVDGNGTTDTTVAAGDIAAEAQSAPTPRFFAVLPESDSTPISQTDIAPDAHTPSAVDQPLNDNVDGETHNAIHATSLAATTEVDDRRGAHPQNRAISGAEDRAQTQTTPAQQSATAPSDTHAAATATNQSTDSSTQHSTAPATVLNTNVAAHAAVQAGLATSSTKNLHVATRGPAPAPHTSQQPNSTAARVEQTAPDNTKSSVVSATAVKSASALNDQQNEATADSQHHDIPHASGPATFVVPSSGTSSSGAPDVPAQPVRAEAVKDATPPDPAPVNPTAIAARAAEALRNAEMHVGWRSDQLGRVDIHAQLRGHEVAAAVRVEDASGRQWLSAELPQLIESLSRQDLRVASLNVADFANHSASSQGGSQSGTPQQQRWPAGEPTAERSADIPSEELFATDTATPMRLSIHV